MNARDILHYGHKTVLDTLTDLPEAAWHAPGACGTWSVKDVVAHLASYEHLLSDVFRFVHGGGPMPYLEHMSQPDTDFNDAQVARRKDLPVDEVLAELNAAHDAVMQQVADMPAELVGQVGTIPWYGMEYALDDFIVYANYGHKREHAAQIAVVKDRVDRGG